MAKTKTKHSDGPKKRKRLFEDLTISVTYPVPGNNANTAPFMVYGSGTPPASFAGQILTGPGGLTLNGVAVAAGNLPAGATWGFTFAPAPPTNTPLSLVLADTTNPGTAVIIAFSLSSPSIAVGGVVTNQPIVTLTGTTNSTNPIVASGPFVVEQPTTNNTTFAVTCHMPDGFASATLRLMTKDVGGKFVFAPPVVFTLLHSAPTATGSVDPAGPNLFDVVYSNPMADTAFDTASYSLQDSAGNNVPLGTVVDLNSDSQTAQVQTVNPLASDTYTLTIGSPKAPVTDQAGNPYDSTVTVNFIVP